MKLQDKLNFIYPESFIQDMSRILSRCNGQVDWYGNATITTKDYDGELAINDLVHGYLQTQFKKPNFFLDLKMRLDAMEILEKVQGLYRESQEALEKTWFVKYMVQSRLFSSKSQTKIAIDLKADLHGLDLKCREFTRPLFRKYFPMQEPESIIHTVSFNQNEEIWIASKIQIIAAYCIV